MSPIQLLDSPCGTAKAEAPDTDVLVIGGGPAGSTAARLLALEGHKVTLLEKQTMPRFQIGESLLPRSFAQLREMGLGDKLETLPRTRKLGAEFGMGDGNAATNFIRFSSSFNPREHESVNIERAAFDKMLLEAARESGAEILEGCTVRRIEELAEGRVRLAVATSEGSRTLRARYLVDASGQAGIVGRHLGTRMVLPHLRKVAYYGHFRGVWRHPGEKGGYITILMCREGWFWLIPLDEERTSIGLVMDAGEAKRSGVPAKDMLRWGIARCPVLAERCRGAEFPAENRVTADFSFTCRPFAGPGYFLAGDAATFLDPIFSTGVCLGMMSAARAAESIDRILDGADPASQHRAYGRYIDGSSKVFFRLVEQFYDHNFRELFLSGEGPLGIHRAIISTLAGDVYPKPSFAVRWRLRLFDLFVKLQRFYPIAPRCAPFSLRSTEPTTLAEATTPAAAIG